MTVHCKHPQNYPKIYCLYCRMQMQNISENIMTELLLDIYKNNKISYSQRGCDICHNTDEGYMLQNELWYSINNKNDFLCLKCVRILLNRNLKLEDFRDDAPINFGTRQGFDARIYIKEIQNEKNN
jgi:hypothetical protein